MAFEILFSDGEKIFLIAKDSREANNEAVKIANRGKEVWVVSVKEKRRKNETANF